MIRRSPCWLGLIGLAMLAMGCGGDDESSGSTSVTTASTVPVTTQAPSTTAPPTTEPATTQPATTQPGTTQPATTQPATTQVCEFTGTQDEQRYEFPMLMTSLVGADIRTGVHECYERIVIELQQGFAPTPGGMPGWLVRYTDDPITLGQSDDLFVELDGDADLLITMNAWMTGFDENGDPVGYDGPTDIRPTDTTVIRELRLIDDFEGQHTWAVGLDARHDVRVFTLTEPDRLVVDIATL